MYSWSYFVIKCFNLLFFWAHTHFPSTSHLFPASVWMTLTSSGEAVSCCFNHFGCMAILISRRKTFRVSFYFWLQPRHQKCVWMYAWVWVWLFLSCFTFTRLQSSAHQPSRTNNPCFFSHSSPACSASLHGSSSLSCSSSCYTRVIPMCLVLTVFCCVQDSALFSLCLFVCPRNSLQPTTLLFVSRNKWASAEQSDLCEPSWLLRDYWTSTIRITPSCGQVQNCSDTKNTLIVMTNLASGIHGEFACLYTLIF